MIDLQITEPLETQVSPDALLTAVQAALNYHDPALDVNLTVAVDTDETLHALNLQYRGINAPTDVLSFNADEIDPETGQTYLGDILISYDRALAQAEKAGHPVQNELQLLAVHGTLHLLGYDHSQEDEKQRMWAAQTEILERIGCRILQLPED
ncbi:rRNA maturation RNase YbeY [Levilinea saccharolytica]|uniref:Endoribonuclease YbeY n=1 Tax=Levilinea saccharolytica TaxID=229921 RepID=A0A0P6YIT0_9CHLR|nr:rRNA maturation RNase YbeY [Levilinea saccharolytica]KPL84993.1 hypothetical protein ADN01_06325 [Levilinea saccharolytica]GAP18089.1 probable rRNA maturation factor YbeY [Levilinea saccharolytica]